MTDQNNMDQNPLLMKKKVKFKKVRHDNEDKYQVDPPLVIDLEWPPGGVTEYEFDYQGNHGLLFIPLPGIFEPINGQDQLFELGKGKTNKIQLRPKHLIQRDGYKANGEVFHFSIFDKTHWTMAIENSPPKMKLGP